MNKSTLRSTAFALFAAGFLYAAQLSSLVPQSDAIVSGTEQLPLWNGNVLSFNVVVDRVFSGDIAAGSTIQAEWNHGKYGVIGDGVVSAHGIWFLKKSTTGVWQCLPAAGTGNAIAPGQLSYPVSTDPLPAALQYQDSAPLMDKLVLEVAASKSSSPSVILQAMGDTNSPAVHRALRYLASLPPSDSQTAGIIGLISLGDTSGLLLAESLSATLAPGSWGPDFIMNAIAARFRSSDPAAVASLGRMATTAAIAPKLRMAALQALRAIHSPDSLLWLAKLLSDPSPAVQTLAAQGISFFANGVGTLTAESVPSLSFLNQRLPGSYHTDETEKNFGYSQGNSASFVGYWTSWWGQHPELHGQN